jgi:RimJ/RimL family protein N-acetyltransferase
MKIRPLTETDTPIIKAWLTPDMLSKINTGSPDSSKPSMLVMIETDDNIPVGLMELSSIDYTNMNARFGIMIADSSKGSRFFLRAVKVFLRQCFIDLELHKIYFRVPVDNEHALKVNRYFGFVEEGVDRGAVYVDGQFKDIVVMSMTAEEFERKCQKWA